MKFVPAALQRWREVCAAIIWEAEKIEHIQIDLTRVALEIIKN